MTLYTPQIRTDCEPERRGELEGAVHGVCLLVSLRMARDVGRRRTLAPLWPQDAA